MSIERGSSQLTVMPCQVWWELVKHTVRVGYLGLLTGRILVSQLAVLQYLSSPAKCWKVIEYVDFQLLSPIFSFPMLILCKREQETSTLPKHLSQCPATELWCAGHTVRANSCPTPAAGLQHHRSSLGIADPHKAFCCLTKGNGVFRSYKSIHFQDDHSGLFQLEWSYDSGVPSRQTNGVSTLSLLLCCCLRLLLDLRWSLYHWLNIHRALEIRMPQRADTLWPCQRVTSRSNNKRCGQSSPWSVCTWGTAEESLLQSLFPGLTSKDKTALGSGLKKGCAEQRSETFLGPKHSSVLEYIESYRIKKNQARKVTVCL